MANMSYCRFENTYNDLIDCYRNIDNEIENVSEKKYRQKLIDLCQSIANECTEVGEEG